MLSHTMAQEPLKAEAEAMIRELTVFYLELKLLTCKGPLHLAENLTNQQVWHGRVWYW